MSALSEFDALLELALPLAEEDENLCQMSKCLAISRAIQDQGVTCHVRARDFRIPNTHNDSTLRIFAVQGERTPVIDAWGNRGWDEIAAAEIFRVGLWKQSFDFLSSEEQDRLASPDRIEGELSGLSAVSVSQLDGLAAKIKSLMEQRQLEAGTAPSLSARSKAARL